MSQLKRVVTSEVKIDSTGPYQAVSWDANDPQREELCFAIFDVLNKHNRAEEADNVFHSMKWKPQPTAWADSAEPI